MINVGPSCFVDRLTDFTSRIDLVAKYGPGRVQGLKVAAGGGSAVLKFLGLIVPGAAWLGNVSHIGTGPAVTVGGTPVDSYDFKIKIDLGGALTTATFKWSTNGGSTWVATGVATAASVALGSTGVTAYFASGTYVLNEEYDFDSVVGDTNERINIGPIGRNLTLLLGDQLVAQVASIESVSGITELHVFVADSV